MQPFDLARKSLVEGSGRRRQNARPRFGHAHRGIARTPAPPARKPLPARARAASPLQSSGSNSRGRPGSRKTTRRKLWISKRARHQSLVVLRRRMFEPFCERGKLGDEFAIGFRYLVDAEGRLRKRSPVLHARCQQKQSRAMAKRFGRFAKPDMKRWRERRVTRSLQFAAQIGLRPEPKVRSRQPAARPCRTGTAE